MTFMSSAALRTKSGRAIRPAVIKSIQQQVARYDRALKLVESAERMVESERPPEDAPEAHETMGPKKE